MHLIPAYGRDYKSKAAFLADWLAGKDFMGAADAYDRWAPLNIDTAQEMGLRTAQVRYKNLRETRILRVKGETWEIT